MVRAAVLFSITVGFDHGLWDSVVPLLTPYRHVIRYDLRGHGASEVTQQPYSVELLAEDALAIASALGVGEFDFVGTSLGGLIGLHIAVTAPGRLRRLVVANASARSPLSNDEWNRRIALAASSGVEPFVEGLLGRMFSASYRKANGPALHTLVESFRAMNPDGYAAAMAALRDADLHQRLTLVHARTLVIAGEADAAIPLEHSKHMADLISGTARLEVLPGGHLSAVESPIEFARAILSHLECRTVRQPASLLSKRSKAHLPSIVRKGALP